jgi:hypothetical protein
MSKNKTATAIAFFLMLVIAVPIIAIQTASAGFDNPTQTAINQGMTWPPPGAENANLNASDTRLLLWNRFQDQIPTHVYLMAAPNPVGVGEVMTMVMFNPQVPPGSVLGGDVAYQYKINVVKPNNDTETLPKTGTFVSDSTGSQFTTYTPDQTGVYKFTVVFQEMFYHWYGSRAMNDYYGTTFLESSYTANVTVQEQPSELIGLPAIPPLPTQYWTRPIEGQNTNWYQVSSNWLSNSHDRDNGGIENRFQEDGIAPNSPHILWTRPTEDNGVVGGSDLSRAGNTFNAGSQYQPRFMNQIIMYGRLYYSPNIFSLGSSDLMDCVDLRTGELLYEVNTTATVGVQFQNWMYSIMSAPNNYWFGYYYSQDDPNEHGIQNPGWIFTYNYQKAIQPERGIAAPFTVVNVPSYGSFEVPGPSGENLRYTLTNYGNSANPNYYLAQWNSSRVLPMVGAARDPPAMTIDAGTPSRYDWNISFPIQFTSSPTIRAAQVGDILWGSNGSWPMGSGSPSYAFPSETTIWAVSLKPESLGQLIYMKNIDIDNEQDNTNYIYEHASVAEDVFVALEIPICRFHVYNMTTGDELFATDAQADINPYGYYTWPSLISVTQTKLAYGMLYTGGYSGMISAYNLTSHELQWRYTAPSGGAKIKNYVLMEGLICDGKLYVGTHEHSADTPLYKGERIRCLNATTGDVLWTMSGWAYPETFATADGIVVYWNNYDAQIYALGKGPTSTTVSAPDVAATYGTPVMIKGTVMDISAGTKQAAQAANFPNGVPAVSDNSMSEWMEYVYMQKARPTNTTGVEVTLSVIDANNNCREIGTTTSDANGFFSYEWTPDIPGKYTVIATFSGSESYWPSQAESAFTVMAEPEQTAAPTSTPASAADLYFMPVSIGMIVAIIAVLALLILMFRRR